MLIHRQFLRAGLLNGATQLLPGAEICDIAPKRVLQYIDVILHPETLAAVTGIP